MTTVLKMGPEKRIKFLLKKIYTCIERREMLQEIKSDELYNNLLKKLNEKEFLATTELKKICLELNIDEPSIETNIFTIKKRKEKVLLHDLISANDISKILQEHITLNSKEYDPLELSNERIIYFLVEHYKNNEPLKSEKKKKSIKEIKEENGNLISEIEFIKTEFKRFTEDVYKIYRKLMNADSKEKKDKLIIQFNLLFDIYKTKENFDYINNVLIRTSKNKNPSIQNEISPLIDIHRSFYKIPSIY